jgi:hypothetical protein
MLVRSAAVVAILLCCACGDGGSNANAQPSTTAAAAPSTGVFLSADGVFLDGTRIADAPAKDHIVRALSDALGARRVAWRDRPDADESQPFPGVVEVALAPATSCQAALAVMHSCSDAGFPNVSLTIGEKRSKLAVSDPRLHDHGAAMPYLWFRADGLVELRKQKCFPAYATVRQQDLGAPLLRLLPHSELTAAMVGCEPGVTFANIAGGFAQAPAAPPSGSTSPMMLSFYAPCVTDAEVAPHDPATVKASISFKVVEDKQSLGDTRVQAAFAVLRPKLLGCYGVHGSRERPGLRTSLLLRLEVGDTGVLTAGHAEDAVDHFAYPPVMTCIEQEARALRLDPPPATFSSITVEVEFREPGGVPTDSR